MTSTTFYNVRKTTTGYMMAKFLDDASGFNVEQVYEIEATKRPMVCSCPSRRQPCKHITILSAFLGEKRVDTEWFYDNDTRSWSQPLTPGLVPEPLAEVEPAEASMDLEPVIEAALNTEPEADLESLEIAPASLDRVEEPVTELYTLGEHIAIKMVEKAAWRRGL